MTHLYFYCSVWVHKMANLICIKIEPVAVMQKFVHSVRLQKNSRNRTPVHGGVEIAPVAAIEKRRLCLLGRHGRSFINRRANEPTHQRGSHWAVITDSRTLRRQHA